jgi:hypothetical protein
MIKAQFLLLISILLSSLLVKSQPSETIIENHIQAIGGEKKWKSLQSLSYRTITEMHGVTTKADKKWINQKSYRNDFELIGRDPNESNRKYAILVHQGKGWKKLPDQLKYAFQPMDSLDCVYFMAQNELEDPFVDYKSKGRQIQYMETEYFNETNYHKFLIRYPSGLKEYCYLDPKTWLMYMRVNLNSETENATTYLDFFTTKEGLVMPKRFETFEGITTIEQLELNPKLKSEMFQLNKNEH